MSRESIRLSDLNKKCILPLISILMMSTPVYASNTNEIPELAKTFFEKLSPFYISDESQDDLGQNTQKKEIVLPENTELIFIAQVGKRNLNLIGDIFAVYQTDGVYLSFYDFISALEFPIEYNVPEGKAEGWFIREHKRFKLDLNKNTLFIEGQEKELDPDTYYSDGLDLFIRSDTLENWFGLNIDIQLSRQNLSISADTPLPIEERYARRLKKVGSYKNYSNTKNPRLETPYKLWEIPAVDVRSTTFVSRASEDAETEVQEILSLGASGDIGYFTGETFATIDDVEGLRNLRLKFFRYSDDRDLLGPLNASRFEIGDISPVRSNFLGGSAQEQGIFISNAVQGQRFNEQTGDIEGDLPPGWDVELYYDDGRLIANQIVGEDSRYFFEDIPLFPGNNDFRLVFYGPQGEIREEEISIPLNADSLRVGEGLYEFSISRNNVPTFAIDRQDQAIDGSPNIAGRIERPLGENTTITFGARYREEFGGNNTASSFSNSAEETLRLATTLTTAIDKTFVSTSLGVDALSGGYGAQMRASRSFENSNGAVSVEYLSEDYNESNVLDQPSELTTNLNFQGKIPSFLGEDVRKYSIGYATRLGYSTSDDVEVTNFDQSLNFRIYDILFNNQFNYDYFKDNDLFATDNTDIGTNHFLNYNFGKLRARGGLSYDYKPTTELANVNAQINYQLLDNLSLEAEAERLLLVDRNEYEIAANYTIDKLTFTPSFFTDSDGRIRAFLTTRFSTNYNPYSNNFVMTNRNLTRNGSLAAFIFVDMDLDGQYSEGDFPAEGVEIEAVQSRRSAITDGDGLALVTALNTRPTDIRLDHGTFENPFWLEGREAFSILPRQGHTVELQIPLIVAGEIDGTVSTTNRNGIVVPVGNLSLNLIDKNGEIVDTALTASDGFYVFSQIYPGRYNIVPDPNDLRLRGLTIENIPYLTITPEDNVVFGEDLYLDSENPILFKYVNDLSRYAGIENAPNLAFLNDHGFILNFGTFRSKLLKALTWFRLSNLHQDILGDAFALIPPSKSRPYLEDGELVYDLRVIKKKPMSLEEAKGICQAFKDRKIECSVEILPRALRPERTTEVPDLPGTSTANPEARAG